MTHSKSNEIDMIVESEVEDLFGDIIREQSQGIGSSDENACIRNIERRFKDINVEWYRSDIKNTIHYEIRKIQGEK
tara:strand:- start:159 stop:386 length:228 start_codon:yes stop_codon:yes gene_type:complete